MNSELEKNFKEVEKNFSELHSISNYRKKSFLNFQKKGFPTRELEDWKFFDFKRIINKKFNKLNINCSKDNINYKDKYSLSNIDTFSLQTLNENFNQIGLEFNYIVFQNGFLNTFSFHHEVLKYFTFERKDELEKSKSLSILEKNLSDNSNSLISFNNAFFSDIFVLNIKDNYQFKKPLVIYNFFDDASETNAFNEKIIIKLGEHSKLNVINFTHNLNTKPIFFNLNQEYLLNKNSILKKYDLNDISNEDVNYNYTNCNVEKNAIFENFITSIGPGYIKSEINCNLNGQYSSGFVNGLMFLQNTQLHEIKTFLHHKNENTKSSQKIKSILDGKSNGIFQGKIYVDSKSQKTDGYQLSNAILLSKESEFDSKPELEIYADDVKCSHGSTCSQLDESAIFYLMSRGIDLSSAKKMLIKGFLFDALETITCGKIKELFSKRLEDKINEYK